MNVRRIVPNIRSDRFDESLEFYTEFLGLDAWTDLGWIATCSSTSNPTAQISLLSLDAPTPHPDLSIEVADVDEVHAQAQQRGLPIVYPLTEEPWGVRRFFVEDPNGLVLNILSHLP
ncbi:MAG: VOC family protein [Dehalococcoidia bacterium]